MLLSHFNVRHLYTNSYLFNHTATTEFYTLSLHDALPIYAIEAHIIREPAYELWSRVNTPRVLPVVLAAPRWSIYHSATAASAYSSSLIPQGEAVLGDAV